MTSFRSWTPLAFSLVTFASRSSTAKQTWLNPSLSSVDPTISQALSPSSSQGSQASTPDSRCVDLVIPKSTVLKESAKECRRFI
jgi:hypothetical protein